MKIKHIQTFALLSIATLPTSAFAQSDDEQWEGAYIGGSIGIGAQNNDTNENVVFDTNMDGTYGDTVRTSSGTNAFSPGFCNGAANGRTPAEGCRNDKDRAEFYLRAGYDIQKGNLVYGVLVDAGTSRSTDSVTAFSTTPAFYTFTRELDYSLGARARVGYAAKGALFYTTGGVTYGKIDNSFATSNTANSFTNNGSTKSWGYAVGGGAEVKVTKAFSVGLEYLHSNYVDDDYVVLVGPGTAPVTNPFRIVNPNGTNMRRGDSDFETHNIRLTASFRF